MTDALAELASTNEELADFAGIAAHDLAAPLRAIAGFAALLEESYADALDARGSEWIDYILAESDRMRDFIEDLLAYSHAATVGEVESQVDLNQVARALLGRPCSTRSTMPARRSRSVRCRRSSATRRVSARSSRTSLPTRSSTAPPIAAPWS